MDSNLERLIRRHGRVAFAWCDESRQDRRWTLCEGWVRSMTYPQGCIHLDVHVDPESRRYTSQDVVRIDVNWLMDVLPADPSDPAQLEEWLGRGSIRTAAGEVIYRKIGSSSGQFGTLIHQSMLGMNFLTLEEAVKMFDFRKINPA